MRATLTLAAALMLTLTRAGVSVAQPANPDPSHDGPPWIGAATGAPADDRSLRAPVLHITSVEVMRSTHGPALDIIRVRGVASSSGWEEAELIPLSHGVPADGVLELIFVARAPVEAAEARGFEEVEAIFPLEPKHSFKGVNVHSASEAVAVSALPGYTESKMGVDDCSKCVGKTFLAKGASGVRSGTDVVREEQIGAPVRVIRPGDGIASADSNPNRLTLILNKEGKITHAVWE